MSLDELSPTSGAHFSRFAPPQMEAIEAKVDLISNRHLKANNIPSLTTESMHGWQAIPITRERFGSLSGLAYLAAKITEFFQSFFPSEERRDAIMFLDLYRQGEPLTLDDLQDLKNLRAFVPFSYHSDYDEVQNHFKQICKTRATELCKKPEELTQEEREELTQIESLFNEDESLVKSITDKLNLLPAAVKEVGAEKGEYEDEKRARELISHTIRDLTAKPIEGSIEFKAILNGYLKKPLELEFGLYNDPQITELCKKHKTIELLREQLFDKI